jgi:hypothetical protein
MEKSRKQNPGVAYDFLDFLYFGQLETVIFREWEVFGTIFKEKVWLKTRLEKVIQVRNEEAHTRGSARGQRLLAVGYCSEIKARIEYALAGDK